MYIRVLCVLIPVAGVIIGCDRRSSDNPAVRINAAASIGYVIEDLAEPIQRDLGVRIEVNAGASGMLAQQIEQGDKPDVFISADPIWMDRLAEQGLIDPASRADLAGNRLMLVGLPDIMSRPNSLEVLSEKCYQPIAVGDPSYVPAGRYAAQALHAHGLMPGEGIQLAEAPNVRAALAYVQSGQCPVGLVYASDAKGASGIGVLLTIDPTDHDPIRYPSAVLREAGNPDGARRVLEWLKGSAARKALRGAGFELTEDRAKPQAALDEGS